MEVDKVPFVNAKTTAVFSDTMTGSANLAVFFKVVGTIFLFNIFPFVICMRLFKVLIGICHR